MKKTILLLMVVFLLLIVAFRVKKATAPTDFNGDKVFTIKHGGLERKYIVHLPADYSTDEKYPLVVAIHGGFGNAAGGAEYFGFNPLADQEDFIVVYPEGTGKEILGKHLGSWNAGSCCPPAKDNNVDDVGFISAMLKKMEQDFSVDGKRIYVTGFSNGGLMAYRLACEMADKIAAVAPGAALNDLTDCQPSRPIPIFHFQGTLDKCEPYNGGTCGGCGTELMRSMGLPADESKGLWACQSAPDLIKDWKKRNNCADHTTVTFEKGAAKCVTYDQCKDNADVTLCTITGGGHTWPGGNNNGDCLEKEDSRICKNWTDVVGPINYDMNATQMIWDFFKKHSLK